MANAFKEIIIGLIMILTFTFLIYGIVVGLSSTYGKVNNPDTANQLNISGINQTLESIKENAESWQDIFSSQSWFGLAYNIVVPGIPSLMKTIWNFITIPYFLINGIFVNILKIPLVIANIIYALFIIIIIFALWRLYKIGD